MLSNEHILSGIKLQLVLINDVWSYHRTDFKRCYTCSDHNYVWSATRLASVPLQFLVQVAFRLMMNTLNAEQVKYMQCLSHMWHKRVCLKHTYLGSVF